MRSLFAILVALGWPYLAYAQQATCPNYSMGATLHGTGETAYTLSPNDQCRMLVFQNTGAETVTMPKPGANFPFGWAVHMFAAGAGGITLSGSINGGSTLAKAQGTGAYCNNDGAQWWCKP